jgi:hypothetical protein
MFALYQNPIGRIFGMGETEQAARDDAQRSGGSSATINDAQLIRGGANEYAGQCYIRECSPEFAAAVRKSGGHIPPYRVNEEGVIVPDDE